MLNGPNAFVFGDAKYYHQIVGVVAEDQARRRCLPVAFCATRGISVTPDGGVRFPSKVGILIKVIKDFKVSLGSVFQYLSISTLWRLCKLDLR